MGGQALAVTTVLPVVEAARPTTVMEAADCRTIQLNETSAANLPVFDGQLTETSWLGENQPAPTFNSLEV